MAYLDNSGDIILDAVLTDTGRMRLAKGDGSFKITKFAFGDDEINYKEYRNQNNPLGAHPSGSAFYDLSILQTPVLEAFTNNTSLLKHYLVSYVRNDLLYLPVIKMNTKGNGSVFSEAGQHVIAVDNTTTAQSTGLDAGGTSGIINGVSPDKTDHYIRVDFGIDSTKYGGPDAPIEEDLKETQLIVEMDNRLGTLTDVDGNSYNYDFLDDDQIATYVLTNFMTAFNKNADDGNNDYTVETPQGKWQFQVRSSTSLRTSTSYFTQFGSTTTFTKPSDPTTYNIIDTTVRVTGGTTGYSIDIPIRYAKI